MSFIKGNLSLSRFSVLQESFDFSFLEEKLTSRSFKDLFPLEAQEKWGWTLIDDPLSTEFTPARYKFGNYFLFSLRVDTRRIPASLFKLRYLEGEKDFLARHGLAKLSREQRESLREVTRKELATRIPPIPSFYEVCWSPAKSAVYFSGTGQKIRDDFVSYFEETFELPLSPYQQEGDFLTWLWTKAEERNGTIEISRRREIRIGFVKRIKLEAGEGEYLESLLCQGAHADFYEAKEALKQGKKIKEARLLLQEDQDEWEFTFRENDFIIQGMKIPRTASEEEEKDAVRDSASLLERMALMERACTLLDDLFLRFRMEGQK